MLGLLSILLASDEFALCMAQFVEADLGIDFQFFQVGAMLSLHLAVVLPEFFAVSALNPLFQVAVLAVERAHDFDGLIHPLDQAFALAIRKTEVADDERNPNYLAAQLTSAATVLMRFL